MEKTTTEKYREEISGIISIMRFPLLLMVVLIHCSMFYRVQGITPPVAVAGKVMYFFSVSMCALAVPAYFMMSGYLFFGILGRARHLTFQSFKDKLHKRLYRLAVPYLLWNLAGFCIMALFMLTPLKSFFQGLNITIDARYFIRCFWSVTDLHSFFQTAGAPVDDPMWFIRDLIILSALSPMIEWVLRLTRGWILAVLTGLFIAGLWPHIVGFSLTGILFYTLGAWASIGEWRIMPVLKKMKWMPVVAVACMLAETLLWPVAQQYLHALSILLGVTGGVCVASWWADDRKVIERLGALGNLGFFIFAFHMLISAEVVSALCMIIRPVTNLGWLTCYFGAYIILISLSTLLYYGLKAIFPTFTSMLVGGYKPIKR